MYHPYHWSQNSSSKIYGWGSVRRPTLILLRQQRLQFSTLLNVLCLLRIAFIYEVIAIVTFTKIATVWMVPTDLL